MPIFRKYLATLLALAACGTANISTSLGCTPSLHIDETPELLTEVAWVPAALPLEPRGLRFSVTHETVTMDLRPMAPSLTEQERRSLRRAVEIIPASELNDELGGACERFRWLIDLATELQRTENIDFEVHPSVSIMELARVMNCGYRLRDVHRLRFVVRSPEGLGTVELDQRLGPVCRATDEMPRCAQPSIIVQQDGMYVIADAVTIPTEPGCVRGVLESRFLHEPPHRPLPPWAGKLLLTEPGKCPTIPAAELQPGRAFRAVLQEMRRFAPGCPGSHISAPEGTPWSTIAPLLAILRTELNFSRTTLHMLLSPTDRACSDGVVAASIRREPAG